MFKTQLMFLLLCLQVLQGFSQPKHDNKWIIGYDTSAITFGGNAIVLDFDQNPRHIFDIETVDNFHMEGTNTSMCDEQGNLLFLVMAATS